MTSATALKFPVAPGSLELAKSETIVHRELENLELDILAITYPTNQAFS